MEEGRGKPNTYRVQSVGEAMRFGSGGGGGNVKQDLEFARGREPTSTAHSLKSPGVFLGMVEQMRGSLAEAAEFKH